MFINLTTIIKKILIGFIFIASFSYFFILNVSQFLGPEISFKFNLASPNCSEVIATIQKRGSLGNQTFQNQIIPLKQSFSEYEIIVKPSTKIITLSFCPGAEVIVKDLKYVNQKNQPISLSLNDIYHLTCIGCDRQINKDNNLLLKPNPSNVVLQIGSVHEYINMYFNNIFVPINRLPQIIFLVFLILLFISVISLTPSRLEYMFYTSLLALFFIHYWSNLRLLFPPANYTSNKIIASAQFSAFSLKAETYLTGIIIMSLSLIALAIYLRNKRLRKLKKPLYLFQIISIIIFIILLVLITSFFKLNN